MNSKKESPETIDAYIKGYPKEAQEILKELKSIIKKIAPKSVESITYGIPTFKIDGKRFVYFGGFAKHISLFPASDDAISEIKELKKYRVSTGTLKFKLSEEVPYDLIKKFVEFRKRVVSTEESGY